ncbi:MAG: exopolysaccharide biosynthesis protein [Pseudomonadota bacterium]
MNGPLSTEMARLASLCRVEGTTFRELLSDVGDRRGQALFSLFLSVPFLIPIPMPGPSGIIGPLVMLFGGMMALGRPLWLPKRFLRKRCDGPRFAGALERVSRVVAWMEKFVKPRGKFMSRSRWVAPFNGGMIAYTGFVLAFPLPNFLPALAIVLIAIGILEEDGLFVALGYLVTFFTTLLLGAAFFLGFEGLTHLLS